MTRDTGTCDTCGAGCGPAFVRCLPCNDEALTRYLEAARTPARGTSNKHTPDLEETTP